MSKITGYTSLTAAASDDVLPIVDVHDTSMAATGTTKKISVASLLQTPAWLSVSGTHVYEGSGGPRYRATGYNFWIGLPAEGATFTAAQLDTMMARLRPKSLLRCWAPASNPANVSWATTLAYLDNLVTAAGKYGHRLILTLGLWNDTSDYYAPYTSAWITGQQYLHSVFGANSFQDWVTTVAARYAANPTVAIYDLMNEPHDSGSNTSAWATFCSTVSGWIKAIEPNALVYIGIDQPSSVGGLTAWQTITASMDLVGTHEYATLGYTQADDGHLGTLSKPVILDEYGFWAKGHYGSFSDTDLDDNGLPAMTHAAQAWMTGEYFESAFRIDSVFGALIWSYMDLSPTTGPYSVYQGKGQYEPVNGSPTHDVIRTFDLRSLDDFNRSMISNVVGGFTSAQAFRYPDGTNIWGTNGLSDGIFDRYVINAQQYTQSNSNAGATARHSAITIKGQPWPSLQFNGSQRYYLGSNWGSSSSGTLWAVVQPTSLPASGNYYYLEAPNTVTADAAVRINSAGQVQLVQYASATGGTVVAQGGALAAGQLALVMVSWVSGGAYRIDINTVTVASGTAATTYTPTTRLLCVAQDLSNGFTGHVLEILRQTSAATEAEISVVNAYLTKRYLIAAA